MQQQHQNDLATRLSMRKKHRDEHVHPFVVYCQGSIPTACSGDPCTSEKPLCNINVRILVNSASLVPLEPDLFCRLRPATYSHGQYR